MDKYLQIFALLFVLDGYAVQAYPTFDISRHSRAQLRCSYASVQKDVLPYGGFSSKYVERVGIVKNIKECVRSCCGSRDCDIAFMLANRCYRLSCSEDPKKCEPVQARRKHPGFFSQMVKLMRKPIDEADSTFRMKSHKDELHCTHSPISTNVTLRGGVKAGNFSDLGEVESMHMCTALCCAKPTCDLAFMIGDSCIAVECASEEMCQTVRARPTGFRPKISYIRRREINQNVKKAKIASTHSPPPTHTQHPPTKPMPLSTTHITYVSNRTSCTVTVATPNITLRHGLDGENSKLLGKANTMEECLAMCCNNIGGNTAFLLGDRCYVVQCPAGKLCDTIPLVRKGVTSEMAYLQKPRSRLDYDGIDDKTANEMRHTLCSGKRILANHAINGGLEAGNFTEISGIDSIENCTVLCCREKRCEMAMLLNGVCFVGNCWNKEKCKPIRLASKAGIVSHLGFKIGLEDERLQEKHLITSPNTHKIVSYRLPAPTILKTSTCSAEKIFHNVTLIGGMKAANITSLGKASNMQECIGMSCDYGQGDLVLMLEKNCYTVKCINERVCQTAPAQPSKFYSRVAYLKWGSTINETDLTLDQTESKRYPKCSRSHILHNHTLKGGLRAGNFSVISQVDSIENCAAICCNEENCDLALMLDEVCYIGDCANTDLCVPVPVFEGSRRTSQIAFISNPRKALDNDLIKDYSMIYILVGSFAMVISVAGLMWSVCLCVTRKRLNSDKDRLSMVDKDGDSLQDMQMYSPTRWSKESGLHSLGGGYTNNGPLFLSDSESEDEDDFTALEEYKKHRAEHEHTTKASEKISPNPFPEKNYIDMINTINQKVRKSMQNL